MEQITICYDFCFKLEVRKKNGKIYKSHFTTALGTSCNSALWSAYFDCKRKKITILKICEVRAIGIAFAFDQAGTWHKLSIADYPPELPPDLNAELQSLPQID